MMDAIDFTGAIIAGAITPLLIIWLWSRRPKPQQPVLPQPLIAADEVDLSGAFAVPDTEAWWRAVHQIVDQAEMETVAGARRVTHDPNRCIAAVGAGEGCVLIRAKLNDARRNALSSYRADIKPK